MNDTSNIETDLLNSVNLPEGVATSLDEMVRIAPTTEMRNEVLDALSDLIDPTVKCLCALHRPKYPVYGRWNHPSRLFSVNQAATLNRGFEAWDGSSHTYHCDDIGLVPSFDLKKVEVVDGKVNYLDGRPYYIETVGTPGWGIVAANAGLIALDIDGEEAVSWLLEKGLWEQVKRAADKGFSWTSGKPYRFQVLVQADEEVRGLLEGLPASAKPDPTNSFEVRHGDTIQSALPGSIHSIDEDGVQNTYRLISSEEPVSLDLEEFWLPVVAACHQKITNEEATPSTSTLSNEVAIARVEAIKSSKRFNTVERNAIKFDPPCHKSTSKASGVIYLDTGKIECKNCGVYGRDLDDSLSTVLKEEENIILPHLYPSTKRNDSFVDECNETKRSEVVRDCRSLMESDDELKSILSSLDERTDERSASVARPKEETASLTSVATSVARRSTLSKRQREESDLLETAVTDGSVEALAALVSGLSERLAIYEKREPRFTSEDRQRLAYSFQNDNPVVWCEEIQKFYKFEKSTGCYHPMSRNGLASGVVTRWAKESQGLSISLKISDDITARLIGTQEQFVDSKGKYSFRAHQERVAFDVTPFKNVLVKYQGKGKPVETIDLRDASSYYLTKTASMKFDIDATDKCYLMAWLKMMAGGSDRALLLVAFLGCILYDVGANIHQKIVNLQGPPGSGKSDFIRLASMLSAFVESRSLADIEDSKFGLEGLDVCKLLVMPDESYQPTSLSNMKSLFGADAVGMNSKNKSMVTATFAGNGVMSQNGTDLLKNISSTDRKAFERRQIVIKVAPRSVVPGFPKYDSTSHQTRLERELPALVNFIYENFTPEDCTRILSNSDELVPSTVEDKASVNESVLGGVESFVDQRVSFTPDNEATVPLAVKAVHEELKEEYGFEANRTRFYGDLLDALGKLPQAEERREEYLKTHPGEEKTALETILGVQRRRGSVSFKYLNVHLEGVDDWSPLDPEDYIGSLSNSSTKGSCNGELEEFLSRLK